MYLILQMLICRQHLMRIIQSWTVLADVGVANAIVGIDLMPTEERGAIGQVKPSGWHTIKYEGIDGNYLYNRCHLIGYQLSGENANEKNLITGTRYLNVTGMLPFEDEVADYVKQNNAHVRYRVTPIFEGDNLVASGVQMEAKSVEDNGAGILFNVFCYNVQPGVTIDYATGDSALDGSVSVKEQSTPKPEVRRHRSLQHLRPSRNSSPFCNRILCRKCKEWKDSYCWSLSCNRNR